MVTKIGPEAVSVTPAVPEAAPTGVSRFEFFFAHMLSGLFANHQQWNDVEAKIRKAAQIARAAVEYK